CHVGELELRRLKFRNRLAELLAIFRVGHRLLQCRARRTHGTRADIDAPAVQSHHRDAEAFTFRADAIGDGHTTILEDHLRRGLAVPAHLALLLAERKTGRALLDDKA